MFVGPFPGTPEESYRPSRVLPTRPCILLTGSLHPLRQNLIRMLAQSRRRAEDLELKTGNRYRKGYRLRPFTIG